MSYNKDALAKLAALKSLAEKTKAADDALSGRIKSLEDVGAQKNVLEGVKINGTALTIADKLVDILIAAGSTDGTIAVNGVDVAVKGLLGLAYKAEVSESELASALKTKINSKVDSTFVGSIPEGASATTVIAYIAEAVSAGVASADHLARKKVSSVGDIDVSADGADKYIYMVPSSSKKNGDNYDEYMVIDGSLEKVGDWAVDLSDYAKDSDLTALKNLVGTLPSTATATTIVGYIDEAIAALDLTNELAKKADKVTEATAGNFAGLDASGNLTDSGKKASDFVATSDVATDAEVTEMLTEVFGASNT
jgi:hypothetical protein